MPGQARTFTPIMRLFVIAAGFVTLALASSSALADDNGLSGAASSTVQEGVSSPTVCGPGWGIVPSPNVGPSASVLEGVDAVSANDVWAVGHYGFSGALTLVQRWNGTQWSVVPSPNIGTEQNYLYDVAAVTGNDVWAVGSAYTQTLILHWNGTAWSIVPSPNVGTGISDLYSVTAVSANDVWAVGSYFEAGSSDTLVLHWNGTQWSRVASPNGQSATNTLLAVDAVSANDVWAVGYLGANLEEAPGTLIIHWNGTEWSVMPSPNPGLTNNLLYGVAALSENEAWAVGNQSSGSTWSNLAMRWNGTAWSVVSTPNPGIGANLLYGLTDVDALSSGEVWAVGNYFDDCTPVQAIAMRWNGTAWSVVPALSVDIQPSLLHDVSILTADDVWAVGEYENESIGWPQTLTERYAGHTTRFSDVCASDYFYQAVLYLDDLDIVSGYADGTFRPYNTTTRGQAAKIMVLAFDWKPYAPPTPTFSDVPSSHPFYTYIETANRYLIAQGYADGTFRPFNNVTRGQLAKMLAKAALWELVLPLTPTFSDVPMSDPFFRYVETAYCHCAMSGYADGTFRPYNNATRGQVARALYRGMLIVRVCTAP